jgi:hypothetical protein
MHNYIALILSAKVASYQNMERQYDGALLIGLASTTG